MNSPRSLLCSWAFRRLSNRLRQLETVAWLEMKGRKPQTPSSASQRGSRHKLAALGFFFKGPLPDPALCKGFIKILIEFLLGVRWSHRALPPETACGASIPAPESGITACRQQPRAAPAPRPLPEGSGPRALDPPGRHRRRCAERRPPGSERDAGL